MGRDLTSSQPSQHDIKPSNDRIIVSYELRGKGRVRPLGLASAASVDSLFYLQFRTVLFPKDPLSEDANAEAISPGIALSWDAGIVRCVGVAGCFRRVDHLHG